MTGRGIRDGKVKLLEMENFLLIKIQSSAIRRTLLFENPLTWIQIWTKPWRHKTCALEGRTLQSRFWGDSVCIQQLRGCYKCIWEEKSRKHGRGGRLEEHKAGRGEDLAVSDVMGKRWHKLVFIVLIILTGIYLCSYIILLPLSILSCVAVCLCSNSWVI